MAAPGYAPQVDGGATARLSSSVRYALVTGLLLVGVGDLAAIDLVLLPRYLDGAWRAPPVLSPPAAIKPNVVSPPAPLQASQPALAPPPIHKPAPSPSAKLAPGKPALAKPALASSTLAENPAPAFSNLLFATNSSWLSLAARESLTGLAATLAEHPTLRVVISGHTDSSGPEALNRALSLDRARKCDRWLEDRGVDPTRIEVQSFGSTRPLAGDRSAMAQARNRRVEIDLH
jgi:outer membrane protein OmpA-like peptidoglycan-associated protein